MIPKLTFRKLFILSIILSGHFYSKAQHPENRDSLIAVLYNQQNDFLKVDLMNRIASSFGQSNVDSLHAYALKARKLSEKNHDPDGLAGALHYEAVYYDNIGDYQKALSLNLRSIHLFDSISNKQALANGYLFTAQIYKDLSGQGMTLAYILKGLDYSRLSYGLCAEIHDTAGLVNSLNEIGILSRDYAKLPGNITYYDTALRCYNKAMLLIEKSGKGINFKGKLLNNTSQVYSEYKKDYKTALNYLFQALDFNTSRNNHYSLTFNYGNISSIYMELNDEARALEYAGKQLAAALFIKRIEKVYDAYKQYYEVFSRFKKPDSALHYFVLASDLNDSLTNVAKTKQILELQTRYETEKKEGMIVRLDQENTANRGRIVVLGILLLLVALLAIGFILLFSRVKKQKRILDVQSRKLALMMGELHHRVKNNLQIVSSLLSLQTYKVEDEGTIGVLKQSQQRVQAMSLIHQKLYKNEALTSINMKDYLIDLVESLMSSYGYEPDDFDLQLDVINNMVDIDRALPIGLIVNELVTNAFKYAYTGIENPSLCISLKENAEQFLLCIKDNGVGITTEQWKNSKHSFGQQLVSALCRQLRARQELQVNDGTAFMLTIPKKAA